MSTVMNFRAQTPTARGTPSGLANSKHHGPYSLQNSLGFIGSKHPASKEWSVTALERLHAVVLPGLRRPPPVAQGSVARVPGRLVFWNFAALAVAMRTIRRCWLEHRISTTLERLDDRTLKDIGVCRSEILHVARTRARVEWQA